MTLSIFSGENFSIILVFIEGLLSFFSPCIIPLLPVYMSYLAGSAKEEVDGEIHYKRKTVFLHTVFFTIGISFAFFVLLMAFTAVGSFFNEYQNLFTRIGGIIIIILGLYQLGVFDFKFLQKERRMQPKILEKDMNPLIAFVMGFTFSFAWTPCIGPMLSSVLILASTAKSSAVGVILILAYTLGFTIPFLILGLFTTKILGFLNKKKNLLKYTIKAGGIILVIIGIMTFTGWMNGVSSYLNSITNDMIERNIEDDLEEDESGSLGDEETSEPGLDSKVENEEVTEEESETENEAEADIIPAIDFTLTDQYGNEHTLSDYKGKVVFLNFWATWCPPCKMEMPDIEKLYQEFNYNQDDVVILGVSNPRTEDNPNTQEVTKDEVIEFLDDNGYTFPTVFDETGEIYYYYYIQALPTTFLIDKEGNVFGYYPGMMTESIMKTAIEDTAKSTE